MYSSGNQLIDPKLLFEKARLHEGMHIDDLGCGRTGHVVFPGAMVVGELGLLYAVDILKDVLENIRKRAAMESLINVHTVWSDLEKLGSTSIPEHNLDVGFVINVLFQSKNKPVILDEALRLLKDKARLVVVDWARDSLPFAPPKDKLVNFDEIKKWARQRGLFVQEEFSAGPYHKGIVFFKQT
jgi:ubiquinone/menaquinone biosynthesis C-methylase UbiE